MYCVTEDRQTKETSNPMDKGASPQVDPQGLTSAPSLGKWSLYLGLGVCKKRRSQRGFLQEGELQRGQERAGATECRGLGRVLRYKPMGEESLGSPLHQRGGRDRERGRRKTGKLHPCPTWSTYSV